MTKSLRRLGAVLVLGVVALFTTAAAFACDGRHDGDHDGVKGAQAAFHMSHHGFRYTTTITSPDTGTCADNVWANDVAQRTYVVKKNSDGSYRLTAFDRGMFTTVAGQSPEACNSDNPKHGSTVTAGIKGHYLGFLTENITGGTFNKDATCANCTRAAFVAAFFGPSAKENLDKNVKYVYVYSSHDAALKYHTWIDKGYAKSTGGLITSDRGDIATA